MLHGGHGVGGGEGKGEGCLEWLVHGQVCSQRCVGKRHIKKSEFWFLIQLIFSNGNCMLLSDLLSTDIPLILPFSQIERTMCKQASLYSLCVLITTW